MKGAALLYFFAAASFVNCDTPDKFTPSQITALVSEIVQHTPNHTHSVCVFHWVLYTPPQNDAFRDISSRIQQELAKQYTVYTKKSDIPPAFIYEGTWGQGYDDGFEFSVDIRRVTPDILEIQYDDFEDPLAASSQTIRYRWADNAWTEASQPVPMAHICSVSKALQVRDLKKGQQRLVSPTQPMNCVDLSVVLATAELGNVSDLTLLSGIVTLENTETKDITVEMRIYTDPKGECSLGSLTMPVTIRSCADVEAHYALDCGGTARLSQEGEVVLTIFVEKTEDQ